MSDGRRIVLARRPQGIPVAEDFAVEAAALPELGDGEMLVRNRVFAIDAAIRGFLDDRPSYLPPVALGETVRGMVLGEVVESRLHGFAPGDHVRALAGWEEFSVMRGDALGIERCAIADPSQLSLYMGTLGPSGLTAYVGLFAIGALQPGETVAISAAVGAVGNVAGQIARIVGARPVAITGSAEKAALCRDLGYAAIADHSAAEGLEAQLDAALPDGAHVYFDNVGGRVLDAMLPRMRDHGRIVVCGMIGDYNDADNPTPVRNLWQILVKRASMRGFLTYEHPEFLGEAQARIGEWVKSGALRPIENVSEGLESAPGALIRLMSGRTTGKTVVSL